MNWMAHRAEQEEWQLEQIDPCRTVFEVVHNCNSRHLRCFLGQVDGSLHKCYICSIQCARLEKPVRLCGIQEVTPDG